MSNVTVSCKVLIFLAHAKINLKMTCIDNLSLDLQLSHKAPTHSSEAAGLTFQKVGVSWILCVVIWIVSDHCG